MPSLGLSSAEIFMCRDKDVEATVVRSNASYDEVLLVKMYGKEFSLPLAAGEDRFETGEFRDLTRHNIQELTIYLSHGASAERSMLIRVADGKIDVALDYIGHERISFYYLTDSGILADVNDREDGKVKWKYIQAKDGNWNLDKITIKRDK